MNRSGGFMVFDVESRSPPLGYARCSPTEHPVMDIPTPNLQIGNAYYQCGCTERNGIPTLEVSTWIYDGVVSHECTSPDCDQPFHYYKFVELQSRLSARDQPELSENAALIPSIAQVSETMLDVSTFESDVVYWTNAIRKGTAFDDVPNSDSAFSD